MSGCGQDKNVLPGISKKIHMFVLPLVKRKTFGPVDQLATEMVADLFQFIINSWITVTQ